MSATVLTTTSEHIKTQLLSVEQEISKTCQNLQQGVKTTGQSLHQTIALMCSPHQRKLFWVCMGMILVAACISLALIAASLYRCKSMETATMEHLAKAQGKVEFLEGQHQKLFQKFNTLEAYSEDGRDYLALSKGWKIKEIREQSGKILWAIVKR